MRILTQAAETARQKVEERWHTLDSARSDAVIDTRIAQYEEACRDAARKRECAENFCFLSHCLVGELRLCDEAGALRERQEAEGNLEAALDLLDTLGVTHYQGGHQRSPDPAAPAGVF